MFLKKKRRKHFEISKLYLFNAGFINHVFQLGGEQQNQFFSFQQILLHHLTVIVQMRGQKT